MAKKIFQLGFSSEIKVPQLGSARARKFQLGLISTIYIKLLVSQFLQSVA